MAFVVAFSLIEIAPGSDVPASYQDPNLAVNSALLLVNGCDTGHDTDFLPPIKKRTWISMSMLEVQPYRIGNNPTCTLVAASLLSDFPKLQAAIDGADGCATGIEVCQISYGMSSASLYPNGIAVDDSSDYELSLTSAEATELASLIDLQENPTILAYQDNFYLMAFHTTDGPDGAQLVTEFDPPLDWHPISINQGESVSFDFLVRTWATYGGPIHVSMEAAPLARDSGLAVSLEPDSLIIDERSEAKATLTISAPSGSNGSQPRPGIYEIYVTGSISNSSVLPSPCGLGGQCPVIRVGDSGWTVSNYGNDTDQWMGGRQPPEWLRAEIISDKNVYLHGEHVTLGVYLINDGDQRATFDTPRIMVQVFSNAQGGYRNLYGIDASLDGSVTIEPKSRILLAREFVWDQKTFGSGMIPSTVSPGAYGIDLAVSGHESHVFYARNAIVIEAAGYE
jgi:hypothetical protein